MRRATDDVETAHGDTGASFEEFFLEESSRLGKALYLLTGDVAEAEDLVQEAMARALVRWERVRSMQAPAAYVYRVALNLHRRRQRRRRSPPSGAGPSRWEQDPASVALSRSEVLEALRAVSLEQREALLLVEWLGLSAEEAGRVLRVGPGAVRSRIHRARTVLRERLGGIDV